MGHHGLRQMAGLLLPHQDLCQQQQQLALRLPLAGQLGPLQPMWLLWVLREAGHLHPGQSLVAGLQLLLLPQQTHSICVYRLRSQHRALQPAPQLQVAHGHRSLLSSSRQPSSNNSCSSVQWRKHRHCLLGSLSLMSL
jgi:hypothetical protein